jgi:DNA-binding NarL/FixJ family response regulator
MKTVLKLKFEQGLNEQAIAKQLNVSTRTIRNYWQRMQQAFEIQDEPDKDIRILISLEARRRGWIE